MTIHIALLRGINVSGHNKIKMTELKSALEKLGLAKVQTYIQSGNVLFESEEEEDSLRLRIGQGIQVAFGLSITVMLRTAGEWERLIEECPFAADSLPEGNSVHLTLMNEEPSQKAMDILFKNKTDIDEYHVQGREIYFLFRQRITDSSLGKSLQKLGDSVTTRNWNTIVKLDELAKAMEG